MAESVAQGISSPGEEDQMEEGEVIEEEEEFLPGYQTLQDYSKVRTKAYPRTSVAQLIVYILL